MELGLPSSCTISYNKSASLFREIQEGKGELPPFGVRSVSKHVALRQQKRGGVFDTGRRGGRGLRGLGGGGGVSGSTARSDPEDRGGRGPSPEQQLCYGSGDLAIA